MIDKGLSDGEYVFKTTDGKEIKIKTPLIYYCKPPHVGTTNLIFKTADGIFHRGKYVYKDFKISQPLYIDQIGHEYEIYEIIYWEKSI